MLVAVGDTEPPPTLVQTLSLGRERWGESMAVAWQALHRRPRRVQIRLLPTLLSERFWTTKSYPAILNLASKLLKLSIEVL